MLEEFGTLIFVSPFDSGWGLDQGAFEPDWFSSKITSGIMLAVLLQVKWTISMEDPGESVRLENGNNDGDIRKEVFED